MTLMYVFLSIAIALAILLVFGRDKPEAKKKPEVHDHEGHKSRGEQKSFWQKLGFVDLTPNVIRAVVAGNEESGPILRYISNVRGKRLDGNKMVELQGDEKPYEAENSFQEFLRESFGKVWIGIAPFRNIRPIFVDRVIRKDTGETTGKKSRLEGMLKASKVRRYGLYGEFPRPTYHHSVDTKDQVRFNVISTAIVEVVDPEPAFTIYNDNLLETVSDIIGTFISFHVLQMTWDDYKALGGSKDSEGRGTEKFRDQLYELNERLKPLGVQVRHLYISDPEISEEAEDMQRAVEATKIAEERARARRAEGKGEKDYISFIAEGRTARVKKLVEFYMKKDGMTRERALEEANKMVMAEFNAEAVGNLKGTYVAGGAGVQLAVPAGGDKK